MQYLRHQKGYTPGQQAHYIALVETLAVWAQGAPISDRARARSTIAALVGAAGKVGFDDEAGLQAAGMEGSLQQLARSSTPSRRCLAATGWAWMTRFAACGASCSVEGDNALVRLHYDLAGREMSLQLPLSRREGHWYLTRTLADTDACCASRRGRRRRPARQRRRLSHNGADVETEPAAVPRRRIPVDARRYGGVLDRYRPEPGTAARARASGRPPPAGLACSAVWSSRGCR